METRLRSRRRRRSNQANEGWNLPPDESRLDEVSSEDIHGQNQISHHSRVSMMETIQEPPTVRVMTDTPKSRKESNQSLSNHQRRKESNNFGQTSNSTLRTTESHTFERISRPIHSSSDSFNTSKDSEIFVSGEKFFSNSNDFIERQTSDYFSSSDTPQKLRESTRRLTLSKPSSPYIAYSSDEELLDWWNSPKTDYTYSNSNSYRERVSPERKVGSPNMSRRGLRGLPGQNLDSSPFSTSYASSTLNESADRLRLRSRNVNRLHAFSDTSEEDEADQSVRRSTRSSVSRATTSERRLRSSQSTMQSSTTKRVSLSYGLDGDISEEVPQQNFHTATPLVRSGGQGNSLIAQGYNLQTMYTSQKLNHSGIGNGLRAEEKTTWKNAFSTWSQKSYNNVRQIFGYIFLTSIFTMVKISNFLRLSQISEKSSNLVRNIRLWSSKSDAKLGTRTLNYARTIITRTSTVVTTVKRRIVYSTQHARAWYVDKKRSRPILWFWLPLLVGALLLAPFLGLFMREDNEETGRTNPYIWFYGLPLKYSGFENLYRFVHQLSESIADGFDAICSTVFYGLSYICGIISGVVGALVSLIMWAFNLLFDIFNFFGFWLFSSSNSGGENSSIHYRQSNVFAKIFESTSLIVSDGFYQTVTLLSSFSSVCVNGLGAFWNLVWSGIVFVGCIVKTLGLYGFDVVLGFIYFILSMFSGVGSFAAYSANQIVAFFSLLGSSLFSRGVFRKATVLDNVESVASAKIDESQLVNMINIHFEKTMTNFADDNARRDILLKEEISALVRQKVENEVHLANMRSDSYLKELNSKIRVLEDNQQQLLRQLDNLGQSAISLLTRDEYSEQQILLESSIKNITGMVHELQNKYNEIQASHFDLLGKVDSCCNRAFLTIEDVQHHVKILLSELVGLPPDIDLESSSDDGQKPLSGVVGGWLRNYFVAKEELEEKLNAVIADMKSTPADNIALDESKLKETMYQTRKEIMDTIIFDIQKEIHEHQIVLKNHERVIDEKTVNLDIKASNFESKVVKVAADEVEKYLPHAFANHVSKVVNESIKREITSAFVEKVSEGMQAGTSPDLSEQIMSEVKSILPGLIKDHIYTDENGQVFINSKDNEKILLLNINNGGSDASYHHTHSVTNGGSPFIYGGLNESQVSQIVHAALLKFDADKTGMVDHALESSGGSIVSTRCTEEYVGHHAEFTLMGFSIYRYSTNTPRSIIQPDRMPGQCFAFKGSQGYIVIRLAGPVKVTGFTLEHIPASLSPSGSIDSAPKDFSAHGLKSTQDAEGFHFGNYAYDKLGEPLQYFEVMNFTEEYFPFIELKIHNNYGHVPYTCIYRFRVHGVRIL